MNLGKIVAMVRCAVQCGCWNAVKMYTPSLNPTALTRLNLSSLRHPLWVSKDKFDEFIFREVVLQGEYDQDCIRSMRGARFIIDAGAHIGLATVQFATWFPEARIVSIEPSEKNFAVLCRNAAPYPNVSVIHGALWSRNTALEIENRDSNSTGFRVREATSGTIVGVTIPEVMRRFGSAEIDLLKMDIEGTEKEIFEASTEEWLPKTRTICIELHDWLRSGCAYAFYSKIHSRRFNQYQPPPGLVDIVQFT
ncbi:MAG: FkbM family methyltransferase [Acidobacteriia bacterium]|nr:FkbM family methyltransferase [Terriglobia bacterium]